MLRSASEVLPWQIRYRNRGLSLYLQFYESCQIGQKNGTRIMATIGNHSRGVFRCLIGVYPPN